MVHTYVYMCVCVYVYKILCICIYHPEHTCEMKADLQRAEGTAFPARI